MAMALAALVSAGFLSISGQTAELPPSAVGPQTPPADAGPAGDAQRQGRGDVFVPAAPPQDAALLPDVIVDGRRLAEASRDFLEEVGAPPRGTRPGRWNSPICVSVTGMRSDFAQVMIDRIARRAFDAGVDVEGAGCRPNVVILATDNGPAMAARLVDEAGIGFRPAESSTNLGRSALDQFRTSDAPVRWWHVTIPTNAYTGEPAVRFRGQPPPTVNVRDVSRIRSNIRYDLGWVVIVVDMGRTGGVSFGALSDYVALATLAQLDAGADMSRFDTILNLFDGKSTVSGLTDWDRDYLTALYTTRGDRATESQQMNDLVHSLTEARRSSESSPD